MLEKGIEAFLAIASCHSISEASQLLNLTASAVSRRLQMLEDELGMVLIDRQKGVRQSKLTLAGERFFPVAEQWDHLWRELNNVKKEGQALSLNIGCVDSVNTLIMPPIYKALQNYPNSVQIKIQVGSSSVMYEKMEKRSLDIAFVVQELRSPHLLVTPFYAEEMFVVRLRAGTVPSKDVRAAELDPEYEFYIEWSTDHQLWHDRVWSPVCRAKIQIDTVTLVKELMEDSRHWAIIPKSAAVLFEKGSRFRLQKIHPSPPNRITYMVTHRFPRVGSRNGIRIFREIAEHHGYLT